MTSYIMNIFVVFALCLSVCLSLSNDIYISEKTLSVIWDEYKEKYGLTFNNTEDAMRKGVFHSNYLRIAQRNAENGPYRLAMNQFGHLLDHEFPACFKSNRPKIGGSTGGSSEFEFSDLHRINQVVTKLPESVDWRRLGVVGGVKDQGRCGSCYAFSAVEAIESAYAIKTGKLYDLSEQEIVDCSTIVGNLGCRGGDMTAVFKFAMKHGIPLESCYPYTAVAKKCNNNIHCNTSIYTKGYQMIRSMDEKALQAAVALKGPVSVGIDASNYDFRFYSSGVYYNEDCGKTENDLNHGVLVVGYGVLHSEPHYIVKNSWGREWGMDGYILMARNASNACGIATDASFPVE